MKDSSHKGKKKTAEIKTRVEPKLKRDANKVFKKLGLSESEGMRILLRGLVITQGIPSDFKVPNEETIKAIKEVRRGKTIGPFNSIETLIKELES